MLHSPGMMITETDKSYVSARPLVAGAAIIGPTPIGAAYAPTVVTSYGDYQRKFGTTFMMNRYAEGWKDAANQAELQAAADAVEELERSYKLFTKEDDGSYTEVADAALVEGTYYRIESGEGTVESPYDYVEYQLDNVAAYKAERDAKLNELNKQLDEIKAAARKASIESSKLQKKKQEYLTSIAAKSFFEQGGNSLLVIRVTDNDFTSGKAVVKNADQEDAFTIRTISQGEYINNWEGENQNRTETSDAVEGVIREDGSLVKGTKDNIRWEITDVDEETGTFSLYVRRGDDLDSDKNILEAFTNLSLDPDSTNYILRRIGDQHQVLVEDEAVGEDSVSYVTTVGNYPNLSQYIYIENVNAIYGYFLSDGFTRQNEGEADDVANKLPVTCEGGFSGATGTLFSSDEDEANAAFFEDIKVNLSSLGSVKIQGIDPARYNAAISLLQNADEYDINMIAAPGLTGDNALSQIDMLVALASGRGDLISVVDLVGYGAKVAEVKAISQRINSNYAATYWPWLQMYSSTGRLEWVPASTIIPGVYAFTDNISAPWFAPAGMTRGSVQGVVQTEKKLLKQHRDELYKKNVNPISILPGNGITIYGQKTLQKKATALDRVNVRRLMIELKRQVKNMAAGVLFEQNTKELRNQFKGALDSYLESIVQRRGLYAYKTVVDEVNTSDVIDRNEFRAQIWIQPTKVIEFIYIDFTVTNTGVEFNS